MRRDLLSVSRTYPRSCQEADTLTCNLFDPVLSSTLHVNPLGACARDFRVSHVRAEYHISS